MSNAAAELLFAYGFDDCPVFDEVLATTTTTLGQAGGAGATIDANGQVHVPDLATLLQANLLPGDIVALGPQITAALGTGVGVIQGAQPAFALIGTIASGQTPDPSQIVNALSATVALANPLAGAALFAAGELVQGASQATEDLFRSVGLISDVAKPIQYKGLIAAGQPVPAGPSSAKWIPWSVFAAPYAWNNAGTPYEYTYEHLTNHAAPSDPASRSMQAVLRALLRYGESAGPPYVPGPVPQNDFERFFFELLKKDLEYWANANPYIPARALLHAATDAWNLRHGSGQTVTYQPPAGSYTTQVISQILGAQGDPISNVQEDQPLTVNLGAAPAGTPHVVALHLPHGGLSHGTASAAPSAAPVVATLTVVGLGTAAWFWLGRPLSFEALKVGWHHVARGFR